ncbi:MAG TPA: SDR family NAD(P)-dependent oxidoreductase [Actinoplanes sp.]|nr:SDR family NAD(P)-dependent oxidoreductase [Actinoplanes sp.]
MAERTGFEIAIVGMACRFPGAPDLDAYWRLLRDGTESITFFTDAELRAAGVNRDLLRRADYVKARGMLPDAESFDAAFFDIPPTEAAAMDPQHRVFLELAWTALEHSGHTPENFDGAVGVYAGTHESTYGARLRSGSAASGKLGPFATKLGIEKDYVATRASYKLGLGGPSLSVQTACSTSLVATHVAVQGLLAGECDLALAGGVTVHAAQRSGYLYEPGGIFSPDGHCRPFDAAAAGAVGSSGGGVVALRRLDDALASGDTIHAVILGTGVTNDGARRVGYTAPGVWGQVRAIRAALLAAGIPAETITYVEAHGSGTRLGDPIEVSALTDAFRMTTDATGFCALGSVKGNIGHTHVAAGAAGLIKTVLALRHRQIPASLHFTQANPRIDFASSPFRVNTRLTEWSAPAPLRAGVSSFGLGGTNAHVVLEEAPPPAPAVSAPRWEVITLSARSLQARTEQENELGGLLGAPAGSVPLADVAHTLQDGRRAFEYRTAVVGRARNEAAEALVGRAPGRMRRDQPARPDRDLALLLPGVGDLSAGMGRELYAEQPVFREHFDACAELLRPLIGIDLRKELMGAAAGPAGLDLAALLGRRAAEPVEDPLTRTLTAQPATFAFEYALARMWFAWGVEPSAMLGYSIGEITAACLAGVFRLEDALAMVTERARLIERTPAGRMLAVPLPAGLVEQRMDGEVWLAVDEGPSLCVVSGAADAVGALARRLHGEGVPTRPLRTRHAFHSPLLDGIAEELRSLVAGIARSRPQVPFLSNVSGDWITDDEALDEDYWSRQMCRPVRFRQGLDRLWQAPGRVLLEVGPGQALTSAALQALADGGGDRFAVASMAAYGAQPEMATVLTAAAKLWLAGVPIAWSAVRGGRSARRVPLPTYPFQRRRHWVEEQPAAVPLDVTSRSDPSTWFSVPSWVTAVPPPKTRPPAGATWLVVLDNRGVGRALAGRLTDLGQDVVAIHARQDPAAVLADLADSGRLPDTVVHLNTLPTSDAAVELGDTGAFLERGFFHLLRLARCLAEHAAVRPLHLAVVTAGAFAVTGTENVIPANATVLGPCRVLPQEHPQWTTRCIDLGAGEDDPEETADILVRELIGAPGPQVVAYRGRRRWLPELRPVRLDPPGDRIAGLRPQGHYLILGGFGGIGTTLAGFLADRVGARLVLVGRTPLPPAADWDDWLVAHDAEDRVSRRIRVIRDLEARGGQVLPVCADMTSLPRLRAALEQAEERFGPVDGVIHAAGILAEGLAQLKDSASAADTLATKVEGTVMLDTLLRDRRVDFVVLCSSTVGVFGGMGQLDYCAANAFLDAYAQRRGPQDDRLTVSVDWDSWQHVGMVADASARAETLTDARYPLERVAGHPLLDARQIGAGGRTVYRAELTPERHWLLGEHRMHGHPVVAGTVYLEMVIGALRDLGYRWPIELRDITFLSPCVIPPGSQRRLYLILEPDGDGHRLSLVSRSPRPGTATWIQHVTGHARVAGDHRPSTPPRADGGAPVAVPGHTGPMTLGPRAQCLGEVRAGGEWMAAQIQLPPSYGADLDQLYVHPTLLDIATGFANMYLSPVFRMPLAYARITVAGPLPAAFTSYIRARDDSAQADLATYDLILAGDDGAVLMEIDGLTMKRPAGLAARLASLADGTATDAATYTPDRGDDRLRPPAALIGTSRQGLTPEQGCAAFARILHRGLAPQVIVAPRPIEAVTAELGRSMGDLPAGAALGEAADGPRDTEPHPRPTLTNEYAAPRDDLEEQLARQWQDLLGVARVGVHDNFAELGGHSLFAVRLAGLIRETHQVDLPLPEVLAAATVAQLAQRIMKAKCGR